MLDTIRDSQHMADIFKGFVDKSEKLDKAARIGATRWIKALERYGGWHGPAMQAAMDMAGVGLDDKKLTFKEQGKSALAAIEKTISIYLESLGHKADPLLTDIFDMEEAAEYIGISKDMMYTYVTRQQRLRGKTVGNSMAFSRQQLDEFKKTMRKPGKPIST